MLTEMIQVLVLGTNELLAKKLTRVFPFRSLLCEDSIAQEWTKDTRSRAESIVCDVIVRNRTASVCARDDDYL